MNNPLAPVNLIQQTIAVGLFGHIQWDDEADERARGNLDLQGLTPEGIRRLLHDFVRAGGGLDEMLEARRARHPTHADTPAYYRDSWYRAVIPVPDLFPSGLFVEIRLFDDHARDQWVEIVNAHPQVPGTS